MESMKRALVFGAHPDDEIAMSRTIAKLSDIGVEVTVAIMTDGSEGYPSPDLKDKIAGVRKEEARRCDEVLGVHEHVFLDAPDMGLQNDKPTMQRVIELIRRLKPDAVFTHGPTDIHRDHVATHHISMDACFHAGEPVAVALGAPWRVPFVYYHKGVSRPLPEVVIDVTAYREKRLEAQATQTSQYAVFRMTAEDFANDIAAAKSAKGACYDRFWLAERSVMTDFLPLDLTASDQHLRREK